MATDQGHQQLLQSVINRCREMETSALKENSMLRPFHSHEFHLAHLAYSGVLMVYGLPLNLLLRTR